MNYFITHVVVLGLLAERSKASPDVHNVISHMIECSGANLDTTQCLEATTNNLLVGSGEGGTRRLDSEGCGPPPIDDEMLRSILGEAKEACSNSGVPTSDSKFENTFVEYMTIFHADTCWDALCGMTDDEYQTDDDHTALDNGMNSTGNEVDFLAIAFEYIEQCTGLNFYDIRRENKGESCVLENAFSAFSLGQMESHRRFLQSAPNGEECETPQFAENDLLFVLEQSRSTCWRTGVDVSSSDYEAAIEKFKNFWGTESCWLSLCQEFSDPSPFFMKLIFQEISHCTYSGLVLDTCFESHVFDLLFARGNPDDNGVMRRLAQEPDQCGPPPIDEQTMRNIAEVANATCTSDGIFTSDTEIEKALVEYMNVFKADNCWRSFCDIYSSTLNDDDYYVTDDDFYHKAQDDYYSNDDNMIFGENGIDFIAVAFEYIGQCTGLEVDTGSEGKNCVLKNAFDHFSLGGMSGNRRFLQSASDVDDCQLPQVGESDLLFLLNQAREKCMGAGIDVPLSDYEMATEDFKTFWGSDSCWLDLCEEFSSPSPILIKIMYQELSKCAGVDIDFDSCLVNQALEFMFTEGDFDDDDDYAEYNAENAITRRIGARRVLRRLMEPRNSATMDDDDSGCEEQPNEDEMKFAVGFLLSRAADKCMDLGLVSPSEIDLVAGQFFKLFTSYDCMGIQVCDSNEYYVEQSEVDESFKAFSRGSAIAMLGQCAEVDTMSCTFWKSLENMQEISSETSADGLCHPPSSSEFDVDEIVAKAEQPCNAMGNVEDDHLLNATKHEIVALLARPQCWEDLCGPSTEEAIAIAWMDTCASIDVKPLFHRASSSETSEDMHVNGKLQCMIQFILSKSHGESLSECGLLKLDHLNCYDDNGIVLEAFQFCSDDEVIPPTFPPTSLDLSMSFAYDPNDDYDSVDQYEPEMFLSYSMSMNYDNEWGRYDDDDDDDDNDDWGTDDGEYHTNDDLSLYMEAVCNLIHKLKEEPVKSCMKPFCEIGLKGALLEGNGNVDDANEHDDDYVDGVETPTIAPTMLPTVFPSLESTKKLSTNAPTTKPTDVPTSKPTALPTMKPTSQPTIKPTSSPTKVQAGYVEVSFEVGIKLEGIDVSDLDITQLDSVVNVLEQVFKSMLPEDARVRLLKVGGISVSRRILRVLQDSISSSTGVDVEFEVIMTKQCDTAKCTESDHVSDSLYTEVTKDLKTKMESGSVTTAIQEKAKEDGVTQLENISVSVSSLTVSDAKVTVTEGSQNDDTGNDTSDSASIQTGHGAILSIVLGMVSVISFLRM
mmetsp:Transcript_30948/g.65293  ORF Transcript_30948/g.65293 Transcript_30948/m.65293 type:complete len:1279 (-) Transcript_30948:2901-6737(-)